MVCPPVISEAGARRPRSISNFGGLCQTRKTPTLTLFQLAFQALQLLSQNSIPSKASKEKRDVNVINGTRKRKRQ
jgi:hypothetical protein